MPSGVKAGAMLLLNIFVAAAIPIIIHRFDAELFTFEAEVILGLLIAIILTLAELLALSQSIFDTERAELKLWMRRSNVDGMVSDIRHHLHQLAHDHGADNNLFLDYYENELTTFEAKLRDTLGRNEIILNHYHILTTDSLLKSYRGAEQDFFRATNLLWEVTPFFDATYREYFFAFLELVREKKIREVRRIFLYQSLDDFKDAHARKLLAFHNNSIPIKGKVMSLEFFRKIKKDFNIADGVEDFGIYADRYIYLATTRNVGEIAGVFSCNQRLLAQYIKFFDTCWGSTAAVPISNFVVATVTPEQLFDDTYILPSDMAGTVAAVAK